MSGARSGVVRIVGLGVALALALLLLAAREAEAGKYSVAQCGWYVGIDAGWADTTGGAKFRPDAFCAVAPGADPFSGVHVKSFTKAAQTVSGTRFARWRWDAPPGTAITRVSGTWWQALHDGIEQRIGAMSPGGFTPFAIAAATDVSPRGFVAGFSPGIPAIEDRLLCARAESKWCSLEPGSWSAVRALTITVEDNGAPAAGIGGELTAGGWRRGVQGVGFWGNDGGGGVRFGETSIDGTRVALTEYLCQKALISGEWRGTRMQPCLTLVSGAAAVDTTRFSDGPHALGHCATDFAGNVGCVSPSTVLIDNNPPAHPRSPALAGGEGWRRVDDFDLSWANPDQGRASPIWGAYWRITGPASFDTGVKLAPGRDVASLADRSVPSAWCLHAAPLAARRSRQRRPLLGDRGPAPVRQHRPRGRLRGRHPTVSRGPSCRIRSLLSLTDLHSGPKGGEISYRRLGAERWIELPTRLVPSEAADPGRLLAGLPRDLDPGTYLFRADAVDAAGNRASTTRRADGTEMALRKVAVGRRCRGRPRRGTGLVSSRGSAGAAAAARSSRFRSAPAPSSAAGCSPPTAPASGGAGCGSSRDPPAALSPGAGSIGSAPAAMAAFGFRWLPGPRGGSPSASGARRASTARAAPACPCGSAGASGSTPPRARCRPGRRCISGAGSGPGERRCRAAAS